MQTLIFDFDGTLTDFSDHWEHIEQITNAALESNNIPPIPTDEFGNMRDLSLWQMVQQAHIPAHKLPLLFIQLQKDLREKLPFPQPYPGIIETLKDITGKGVPIGIVTSNVQDVVDQFLTQNNLTELITFSHAHPGLFGKHRALKKVFREHSLDPADIWYIGDEIRDIKAARKAGIRIASVTWGLNTEQALTRHQPDAIFHHPSDLLNLVK